MSKRLLFLRRLLRLDLLVRERDCFNEVVFLAKAGGVDGEFFAFGAELFDGE